MTANTIAGVAALVAAAAGLPGFACSGGNVSAVEQAPPNVIVIMTDDMRVDDLAAMPAVRQLLGARYIHSYASMPLCSPSRATMLTGRYAHNHGVLDNLGPNGGAGAFDDSSTLATWLNPTYQTVMVGKYLNEFGSGASDGTPPGYVPPGWDHFEALTDPSMGNYTDFNVNENGTIRHVADDYQTTYFGDRMIGQIEARIGGEPLFMWASFHAPHTGGGDGPDTYVPLTEEYRGVSQVGLPSSPAVNEAKVGDKPPWVRALPRLSSTVRAQIIQLRRERLNALMYVDDQVQRIVNAVREYGELGNTVFVFTSDNGNMLGEHRIRDGKLFPYRESAEVPLLIRGPGFTRGIHAEPVSNVDLAPTIAALAGVAAGPVDGISLLDPIPADRPILLEDTATSEPVPPQYSGVIQNGREYVEYAGGAKELYDLDADPWQLQNRNGAAAYQGIKANLAATLDQLRGD